MLEMQTKSCSRCRETKSLDQYPGDGRQNYCKPCFAAYMAEWRAKNPRLKKVRQRKPIPAAILFDETDRSLIEQYTWCVHDGYACTSIRINGAKKTLTMHGLLLGPSPDGMQPDHINRNRSDNRRENLRVIPTTHNRQNRPGVGISGYRGVSWNRRYERWQIQVQINKAACHLGFYQDKIFAAAMASTYRAIFMPGATD